MYSCHRPREVNSWKDISAYSHTYYSALTPAALQKQSATDPHVRMARLSSTLFQVLESSSQLLFEGTSTSFLRSYLKSPVRIHRSLSGSKRIFYFTFMTIQQERTGIPFSRWTAIFLPKSKKKIFLYLQIEGSTGVTTP